MALCLAQDPPADALLDRDPLALLTGMLLDQQFPMERAFAAPYLLLQRLGGGERLDAARLAGYDPQSLAAVFTGPPALHRYPGSMAKRVQELCRFLVERYEGRPERIWQDAQDTGTGTGVLRRLRELPGFGEQKARIFLALLGKQRGVRPEGWREAAGPYGEDGVYRSVADVLDADSLARVRAAKKEAKAKAGG